MPDEEKTEVTQEQTDGWDKDRQKVDQLSANVSKLSNERAELTTQLTEMSQRSQDMQDTVARLEAQLTTAQATQTQSESLDPDMYDDKLMQKISKFETEIGNTKKLLAESNAQIKELADAKTRYEQEAENDRETTRKAERKELILTDLDSEFGAKFRNEALKLAQDEVNATGVAPSGDYAVAQLLRKHYKQLSATPGSVTKVNPSVPADNGEGGVVFAEGEIEEGTRDEVMDSIRKKYAGRDGPFTMPTT